MRVRPFSADADDGTQTAAANRDFVRSICAPWERGDFSSTAWADPEIEYVLVDGPSPGRWTGLAEMREVFLGVLNAYAEYQVAAEEFHALDEERVLVLHGYSGRGKTSGLEIGRIASKGADLFHVSDGKVTRLVLYWKLDRALEDLGLVEEVRTTSTLSRSATPGVPPGAARPGTRGEGPHDSIPSGSLARSMAGPGPRGDDRRTRYPHRARLKALLETGPQHGRR